MKSKGLDLAIRRCLLLVVVSLLLLLAAIAGWIPFAHAARAATALGGIAALAGIALYVLRA